MRKLCFLILCSVFVLSTVLEVSTQGLPDAVTWEHLKKSASTSISGVAGNCQRWINEARSNCKASIDQATQLITQKKDNAAVQSLIIQETIEETTSILQSVSSNVHSQLAEVGSRFQKRRACFMSILRGFERQRTYTFLKKRRNQEFDPAYNAALNSFTHTITNIFGVKGY